MRAEFRADVGFLAGLAVRRRPIWLERGAAVERMRRQHESPIGEGFGSLPPVEERSEPVVVGSAMPLKRRGARFQRRLPAQQIVELLLELLLVEQLAAGGAVDLGAQFGDAVFVGVLLLGLARDQALAARRR